MYEENTFTSESIWDTMFYFYFILLFFFGDASIPPEI